MYAVLMLSGLPILLFFSITPFATNVTTLLRSGLVALFAFTILLVKPSDFKKYKYLIILFITIITCFSISFILNEQNYSNFLIGTYGRNTGILVLTALFLLFLQSADYFPFFSKKLANSLYILLGLSLLYGVIQKLDLDPINWEKGSGIGSTLGNPNFYGALLGVLSIIPLLYFFEPKNKYKYLHLITYFLVFIQTFMIGGSQGYIIFIFSLMLFILLKYREVIFHKIKLILFSLLLLLLGFFAVILRDAGNFATILNSSLQIESRIEHWSLSVRIWRDHFLFGVGIENLTNFSGKYRNQTIRDWGLYTLPDKSHNMFLDFFVTGGLFVGLCWIAILFYVYQQIFFLLKNNSAEKEIGYIYVFSIVWTSWLFQSFFSPSHIILEVCGIMAGGALVGLAREAKTVKKIYVK
jgi:O-antigen ligase